MTTQWTRRLALLCLMGLYAASSAWAGHYGEAMPADGEALSLADAIARSEKAGAYEGKIRGHIAQVCKKKGCFMVLVDGEHAARVTFKDYGFFIPKDTKPGMSTVFGALSSRTLTREQADHFAADAGAEASSVALREFQIVASSVVIE